MAAPVLLVIAVGALLVGLVVLAVRRGGAPGGKPRPPAT